MFEIHYKGPGNEESDIQVVTGPIRDLGPTLSQIVQNHDVGNVVVRIVSGDQAVVVFQKVPQ